jgi:hypothetical protein
VPSAMRKPIPIPRWTLSARKIEPAVNHLHLNGRNYKQLVALVPGAQPNRRSRAADAVELSGGGRRVPLAPRVG